MKGYIRHKVDGDGACGYTAFGITRQKAYELLKENISQDIVVKLLAPACKESLLSDVFIQYLHENGRIHTKNTLDKIFPHLNKFAESLVILDAYIDFDVRDKRVDVGWAHPGILRALASIQQIELYIWKIGEDKRLVPHCHELYYDYFHYLPSESQSNTATNLLFINDNHFERLDLIGVDNTLTKNERIYPIIINEIMDTDLLEEVNLLTPLEEYSIRDLSNHDGELKHLSNDLLSWMPYFNELGIASDLLKESFVDVLPNLYDLFVACHKFIYFPTLKHTIKKPWQLYCLTQEDFLKKIDFSQEDDLQRKPIHYLIFNGNYKIVLDILKQHPDFLDQTLLRYAAFSGLPEAMERLGVPSKAAQGKKFM